MKITLAQLKELIREQVEEGYLPWERSEEVADVDPSKTFRNDILDIVNDNRGLTRKQKADVLKQLIVELDPDIPSSRRNR